MIRKPKFLFKPSAGYFWDTPYVAGSLAVPIECYLRVGPYPTLDAAYASRKLPDPAETKAIRPGYRGFRAP